MRIIAVFTGGGTAYAFRLGTHACASTPLFDERVGPVTTFTLDAQGKLERCAALAGLSIPPPRTTVQPSTGPSSGQRINQCIASAKNEVEAKYPAALNAVRLQKGTLSALMTYYDEWEEALDQVFPVSESQTNPADRARLLHAIEELRSKAHGFNGR